MTNINMFIMLFMDHDVIKGTFTTTLEKILSTTFCDLKVTLEQTGASSENFM